MGIITKPIPILTLILNSTGLFLKKKSFKKEIISNFSPHV